MQEFWATVSIHHTLLRFKMNGISHTLKMENFKDMLQICPRLTSQKFKDPPFEEEILSFIRDLGQIGEIKTVFAFHELKSFEACIIRKIIMDTTKAQQITLDDALVTLANHLKIRKCNHRLSSDLKSNEPTIQV
nr:hypothetical protein [Tanacetum cinerariifolium]